MQVMLRREEHKPLQGRIELDDAYLGGARSGGKRGRGAAGKTPVVAAVETTAERRPRKLKLLTVKGFRKKEAAKLARRHLQAGSNVVSDGLSCWTAVATAGRRHFPMVTGSGRQAARWAPFTPCGSPDPHASGGGAAGLLAAAGSTPRRATSRRRSWAPTASSARRTRRATWPALPGASTAAFSSAR